MQVAEGTHAVQWLTERQKGPALFHVIWLLTHQPLPAHRATLESPHPPCPETVLP
jgi:hypothetical protein